MGETYVVVVAIIHEAQDELHRLELWPGHSHPRQGILTEQQGTSPSYSDSEGLELSAFQNWAQGLL